MLNNKMIATGTPRTSRRALPFEIQQNTSASEGEIKKQKQKNIASNIEYISLGTNSRTYIFKLYNSGTNLKKKKKKKVREQIYVAVNWYSILDPQGESQMKKSRECSYSDLTLFVHDKTPLFLALKVIYILGQK